MQIKETENSETAFMNQLLVLSMAGVSLLHVRSLEIPRVLSCMRKHFLAEGNSYTEWDVVRGTRDITVLTYEDVSTLDGDGRIDLLQALTAPKVELDALRKSGSTEEYFHYYVYVGPHYWWSNNPQFYQMMLDYSATLHWSNIKIIFVTPDIPLDDSLSDLFHTITMNAPSARELLDSFTGVVGATDNQSMIDIPDEDMLPIANAGLGLPLNTFELYSSIAIVQANIGIPGEEAYSGVVNTDSVLKGISKGKTEIVNKNDLLELIPVVGMSNVGGMQALKDWVAIRKNCYSQEAAAFGIDPPKGIVLAGLPGAGKSLSARAIAHELKVPLLKLDIGRVFNSLLGKSEERIRTALKMAESMAPIVLFLDEIDKGLGGIQGSGDSGAGSRILGTLLSWLQDHKAPIFTVVTGNNIGALPPELLRRGRMDEIFFTLLPTVDECLEILDIHIRKRGWNPEHYPTEERHQVASYAAKGGYVAAEIEYAVNSALIECFSSGVDLSMDAIISSMANTVPLSKTYQDRIKALEEWGKAFARPTSYTHKPKVEQHIIRAGDTKVPGKVKPVTRLITRRKPEDGTKH